MGAGPPLRAGGFALSSAREAAVQALVRTEEGGYSNLVLKSQLARFGGTAQERAFAAAVFYGTVERKNTLDYCLGKFLQKPLFRLDAPVRAILRAGLYQAKYMQSVPVHAAVSESVALCRRMRKASAAGLINAVLRRAAAVDVGKETFESETQRLCVQYSVSQPVAELLQRRLPTYAERLLAASFEKPALAVRVNTLRTTPQALSAQLAAHGVKARPGRVANSLLLEGAGDVAALPEFCSGLFHVQSEASQAACAALAPRPGEKVLDMCAAPGGKSATLAQYMENKGALFSRDAVQSRVPLIDEALARLGVSCAHTCCADARVYDAALAGADAVLCDVPCTGLGVLAKKPDIRYKSLEGLEELYTVQRAILETSARYVKPGGRLVYSTCTVNPQENEAAVQAFLAGHPGFCLRRAGCVVPGALEADGMAVLLPFFTQTDGFFIASLERLW